MFTLFSCPRGWKLHATRVSCGISHPTRMPPNGDQLTSDLAALKIDREERPRRGILRPLLILAIAGALVAVAAMVGYPYMTSRIFKTEVETTEIALVSPAQASIQLTATGYVVPQTTAKVAAKTI